MDWRDTEVGYRRDAWLPADRARRRRRVGLGALAVVLFALGAFYGYQWWRDSRPPEDTSVARSIRHIIDEADMGFGPGESFIEWLPTTTYRDIDTGTAFRFTDLFVVGDVARVTSGGAFRANGEPAVADDPVSFRTIHVELNPVFIADHTGPIELGTEPVVFGLTVGAGANVGRYIDELRRFGRVVALLNEGVELYGYAPGVYGPSMMGGFIATVRDDETLKFVFAPGWMVEAADLGRVSLPDAVASAGVGCVIDVVAVGSEPFKADDTAALARRGETPPDQTGLTTDC